MSPERAHVSLFSNCPQDLGLWRRFFDDPQITADCQPPEKSNPVTMATETESVVLTASDQEKAVSADVLPVPAHLANQFRSHTSLISQSKAFSTIFF
jgi:hypothetical protein